MSEALRTLIPLVAQQCHAQKTSSSSNGVQDNNVVQDHGAVGTPAAPVSSAQSKLVDVQTPAELPAKKSVPKELAEFMKEAQKSHKKAALRYASAQNSAIQKAEQVKVLESEDGKYPPQVRPFRCQHDLEELDAVLNQNPDDELTVFTVNIPKGASRKLALELIYRRSVTFQQKVYFNCMSERVDKLKHAASKQSFYDAINEFDSSAAPTWNLEDAARATDVDVVRTMAERLYEETVCDIRKEMNRRTAQAQKRAEQLATDGDELAKADPTKLVPDILRSIVKEEVSKANASEMTDTDVPKVPPDPQLESKVDTLVTALSFGPKNGSSPADASGHNISGTRPPQRNPQVTQHYKGKGKGNGKNYNTKGTWNKHNFTHTGKGKNTGKFIHNAKNRHIGKFTHTWMDKQYGKAKGKHPSTHFSTGKNGTKGKKSKGKGKSSGKTNPDTHGKGPKPKKDAHRPGHDSWHGKPHRQK